jgi:uridine kinase
MSLAKALAELIDARSAGGRLLVAVDGPDAAGKTTLARAVTARLPLPSICVSVDGWHHSREHRLRRGAESAEGYYLDSFDVDGLVAGCLAPFVAGSQRLRTASFDHVADRAVDVWQEIAAEAVLIVEGVFLLRPELRDQWDLSVYLHVDESIAVSRAVVRDLPLLGSEEEVRRRYALRYLPGQALYREVAAPLDAADVLVDNSDPAWPQVVRWPEG